MNEKEFASFMKEEKAVPFELEAQVLARVQTQQKKTNTIFWPKLLSIHLLSGALTLSFCPQFGFDPFQTQSGLPHLFMSYGMWACGLFCGVLFFSIGSFLTSLLLTRDEFALLKKRRVPVVLGFSSLALVSLMLIGASQKTLGGFTGASFLSFWFIGAIFILLFAASIRDPKILKARIL